MKTVNIFQCNIQSISKNKNELIRVLIQDEYEIALISECWTKQELEDSKYRIPNYNNFYSSREDGYGGAMVILHRSLRSRSLQLKNTKNIQAVGRYVTDLDLAVVSIYASPGTSIGEFKEGMQEIIQAVSAIKNFVVGGDMNAHSRIWDSYHADNKGEALYQIITNENIILMNDGQPTYIPAELNKRASTIDLVLCSPTIYQDTEMQILDFGIGSSMAIKTTIVRNGQNAERKIINKRKLLEEIRQ